YDQAAGPGAGAGDQPPDYRGAWWPAVGYRQCAPGRCRAVHGADRERGGGLMDAEALVCVLADTRTRLRGGPDRRHHMGEGRAFKEALGRRPREGRLRGTKRGDEDEHLEMAVVITDLAKNSDK